MDTLSLHYTWTTDYAEKRLHWKPRKPLSIMLIRVYRLPQPYILPILDRYAGCKSWVELAQYVPLGRLEPLVPDEEYQRREGQIERALNGGLG